MINSVLVSTVFPVVISREGEWDQKKAERLQELMLLNCGGAGEDSESSRTGMRIQPVHPK